MKKIKIKFQNGISEEIAKRAILNEVLEDFIFEESKHPDFIFFGPYGNDIPPAGPYIRIGYFCENIKPDLSICDWAFGIPREEDICDPRYKRIQWHDINPLKLVKPSDYDAEKIAGSKKYFCNFLYSHAVPYREEFFRQLSKYKKVDAPGASMNNMPGIDNRYKGERWEVKKKFLSDYKFTIAFENYVYPGYQTEKLFDAMQVDSIPIYCGDPFIDKIFNTTSFINTPDYINTSNSAWVNWLQKHSQLDFKDILPSYYSGPTYRIKRKIKSIGRELKMRYQLQKIDFSPLIEKIIELDQNDEKYISMLRQPWFINNAPPQNASLKDRWIEIFNQRTQP